MQVARSRIFVLLVPVADRPPRYRLYLQGPAAEQAAPLLPPLCRELQAGLEENPYYRHAVAVGQLAPVEAAVLDPDGEAAWLAVERRALEAGQKSGDVKPLALDRRPGWPERFAPLLRTAGACTAGSPPSRPVNP